MPGSILVARILGIDIRIHLSWFLIFGLILFLLSNPDQGLFAMMRPTWSDERILLVAAVAALLFFACVLAHELSHALVARAFRMPVSSITLFLLGGVANLAKEPPSARAEFLMAISGPAMSLAIGVASLGIAELVNANLGAFYLLDPVGLIAQYLGVINLALAVFNMIPGFPLDGGRVLRSVVWAIRRDRASATRIAARGGQVVAGLLFLVGITRSFVDRDAFSGVWMALIAYFLYTAASSSLEQEKIASTVAGVRVSEVMTTAFRAVPPGVRLAELVDQHVLPFNARSVAVVGGDSRLRGLVSIGDLRKVAQRDWETTPVEAVMTPARELPEVSPSSRLMTAIERFAGSELPAMPVVEDGRLVGMLEREAVLTHVRMREMLGLDGRR
ncbi:MAG: site-2 protease family protein [Candidatus Limnocylindria bacterium]